MGTPLAGKGGNVKISEDNSNWNTVAEIDTWSLDIGIDALDTTDCESANDWKEFIAGLKNWSGSFSGNWDYTDTNGQKVAIDDALAATNVYLELFVDGTHYWSGEVIITGISAGASVADKVTINCSFQGTGAISYT